MFFAGSVEAGLGATIPLRGHFRVLFLYDVAEAIDLDSLRSLFESRGVEPRPGVVHPIPQYLRFERPPVVEPTDPMVLETSEHVEVRTKYYDYGVVSIELELPFECDWDSLVLQSSRWIGAAELENRSNDLLPIALNRVSPALIRPYKTWLKEDYFIDHLPEVIEADGKTLAAGELLASHARRSRSSFAVSQ
jgi:hypothetical protein